VELPFRINFSAKQKIERLRIPHHLKAAGRCTQFEKMTTPKEIYDIKRKNFVDKSKLFFNFLTTEFDFDKPIYTFYKQSNGVVIADKFEFNNSNRNLKIVVSNSYHPVDYGFEINLIDLKSETEEMIHNVLKDNQDVEQSYIKKASEYLKIGFGQRLRRK
jgi:hypothetical protein